MTGKREGVHDVVIVGGGPAGLSAAIWLGRYLHDVVLVDSGDPRNWETSGVNGYLGSPGVRPPRLRESGREECRRYGVQLVDAIVVHVRREGDERFVVELADGRAFAGRRLLLAIGLRDVWPAIPGLERIYGHNAHICPDCDGYDARGKKIVVIGAGRKAVGMALNLTTWTRDIIICTNGEPTTEIDQPEYCGRLSTLNIPVLAAPIQCITSTPKRDIHCIQLEGGMALDADKIFIAIGQYPADDLGTELGCERDDDGQIVVDRHHHTSVHNVFAAGDIVPGPQLAIAAAAEGAVAALAIHKTLVPEGRKLVRQERSGRGP